MKKKTSRSIAAKIFLGILLSVLGIFAILIIASQIVLSEKFLTKTVNTVAEKYIDGDLKFGRVRASVFRRFPKVSITLDSVSLTYPAERFAEHENIMEGNRILMAGKGSNGIDTLASFDRFSAAFTITSLKNGIIRLPWVELSNPRIFAKRYTTTTANWDIIGFLSGGENEEKEESEEKSEDKEESGSFDISSIDLGRLCFDNNPLLVYYDRPDSLFAMLRLKDLNINNHKGHYDINLSARTGVSMPGIGRMMIPIELNSEVAFPKDSAFAVNVSAMDARIAGIPLKGDISVRYFPDRLWVNADALIDECDLSEVVKRYGKNVWEGSKDLITDAIISLKVNADGWYNFDMSRIPAIDAALNIPDASFTHEGLGLNTRIGADIWARGGGSEKLNAGIEKLLFDGSTLKLDIHGIARDLLGKDPFFDVDGSLTVSLDTLAKFLKPEDGYHASGLLSADIKGAVKKSQMNIFHIADADISGNIKSGHLDLASSKDTLDVHIDSLDLKLKTLQYKNDKSGQDMRVLSLKTRLDSAAVNYRNALTVNTGDLFLNAQSDAKYLTSKDTTEYYMLGGKLDIERLRLMDSDSSRVFLAKSENSFVIFPSKEDSKIPVLSLTSKNGMIGVRAAANRAFVKDLVMRIYATRDSGRKSVIHARNYQQALERKYPNMPKDTLMERMREMRRRGEIPEWLTEEDFKKKDFSFKLDDAIMQYYKDWSFRGNVTAGRVGIATPYFPLRTGIKDFNGYVTNDEITLRNISIKSGVSDLSAKGKISGLRRALTSKGPIRFTLDLSSGKLNVNELLGAYTVGSQYIASNSSHDNETMDDDTYQESIVSDTLANVALESPLFVVPANILADLTLSAKDITYSKLQLDTVRAEISMKERCIQIRNTAASSNVGRLKFDGFYSTRTKKDLKTGFDLSLADVTAEKVIDMVPAVDSILPMLKSFKGLLNCELAATAQLDTAMNINLPSLTGIARIKGKNLALVESEDLFKILKILKFNDIHNINIDDMSVEAVITNNKIEIFPFVLSADRYALALSGIQNMNQTFKYHISILKSPLLIRFGVNLFGNFDKFNFNIGKAKYKSKNVPVFSAVIDETHMNLHNAITNIFSKGIDNAIRENGQLSAINRHREEIGYQNAATTQMEELSDDEKQKLEEGAKEGEIIEESAGEKPEEIE